LFEFNVAFAIPDNASYNNPHTLPLTFDDHLFDNTPLDPFFGWEPIWPFEQEIDDGLGRVADEATQSSSQLLGQSNGSDKSLNLPTSQNVFSLSPEDLIGDSNSSDNWEDTDMPAFLQIYENPAIFTAPLLPAPFEPGSPKSNLVDPLMSLMESPKISSPTPASISPGSETQLLKRKRVEDIAEDEPEDTSTSIPSQLDELTVCLWRNCGVSFKNCSELR
jgi:hypothetical protein